MPGPKGGGLVQGLSDPGGGGVWSGEGVWSWGGTWSRGGGVWSWGVPGPGVGGCWSRGRGVPGPTGVCSGGGWLVPGGDGHCCGRYASYWNAFLFLLKFRFESAL